MLATIEQQYRDLLVSPEVFDELLRHIESVQTQGYNDTMLAFLSGEKVEGDEVLDTASNAQHL